MELVSVWLDIMKRTEIYLVIGYIQKNTDMKECTKLMQYYHLKISDSYLKRCKVRFKWYLSFYKIEHSYYIVRIDKLKNEEYIVDRDTDANLEER